MTVKKLALALCAVALVAAACGSPSNSSSSKTSSGSGMSLSITSPSNGATVTEPFTVHLASSVPLGPTSTGDHHVHFYYDGSTTKYDVITSDSFQVTNLSSGTHTILASLRNADHSPAGPEVKITFTVSGSGGGGGKSGGGGSNSGGGYNY
jgi:hypothetical protein